MVTTAASRTRKRLASFLGLALAFLPASVSAQKKVKVTGFYPDYSSGGISNTQASQLSYAIYFSIKPPADGNVSDEYIVSNIDAQRMIDMVDQGKPRGMGVLLCVGGAAESGNFPSLAANAASRKKFATTLAAFCSANGLAGVDIDWEFPSGAGVNNFTLLAKDLREAFTAKNLVLSTNVNGPDMSPYTTEALQQFDWVQVMSYDNDWPVGSSPHSTMAAAQNQMTAWANKMGAAFKSKLVLGVPFYGKRSAAPQTMTYADILKANPGLSPAADEGGGYNFNGTSTLGQKTNYVIDNGFGGIMIWNLVQDAPDGRLLGSINSAVKAKGYLVEQGPITVGLGRAAGAYAIRPANGDGRIRMRAAPGAYRLSLFSPDGRTLRAASQETLNGDLAWDLPARSSGQYLYRLESKAGKAARETGTAPSAR
ncbi:MAG: hypothetical protein JWP91_2950 [Fibrobacteres bacterium]|nr:hypothetical protein [Fibrobacterota bacterium]